MPPSELQQLIQASAGLLYPSETDAPFDPFHWPAGPVQSAQEAIAAHAGKAQKIEQMALGDFFAELDASDDAGRFDQLRRTLQSQLTDVRVLRVGAVRINVYLIGKTRDGDWAGLHTISVET